MAAVTSVFVSKFMVPGAGAPGGLMGEVWRVPASTAGDTQTITPKFIRQVLFVLGPVSFTVLGAGASVAATTSVTVAASNFVDVLLIGYGPV